MKHSTTFWKKISIALITFLTCSMVLNAQVQVKMTGKVYDETGQPAVGAIVMQQGTLNGVVSDLDGNYEISVPEGVNVEFSMMGYTTQTYKAFNGTLNVELNLDAVALDETVVVGYGVQKKSSLTGSVSQVKSEDMQSRTITSPTQALQGKTAGVQVLTSSAAPGSSPSVRIRGISSNSSTTPLYVVDGRIASDISGIDPNDIESMEVLKDGASAAIYGASAGNGVILITTKKGQGHGKITYDYQFTSQSLSNVPKVMNAEQYIDYYTEAGLISMENVYKYWDHETNTDWVSEAFENSQMHRHNLTFSAGNDKASIYVSLSYLNNDGIIKGDADYYQRYTGMINASWKIKPWLEIGTNNQIEHYAYRSVSEGSEYSSMLLTVLQYDPLTKPYYTADNLPSYMQSVLDMGYTLLGDSRGYYGISPFITGGINSPMIMRDSSYSLSQGFNINGTTYLNFTPVKGLLFTSRFGYRLSGTEYYGYSNDYYATSSLNNTFMSVSGSAYVPTYYQWENFANYNTTIAKKHNLGVMIGMSYSQSRSYGLYGSYTGGTDDLGVQQDNELFYYFAYATSTATKSVSGAEPSYTRKLAYFGRLNYDYEGKYMVQASLRADAADSGYLPITNRWGYFPAVSAGWTVSQENFLKDSNVSSWLNFLKIRASWGQNGSIAGLGSYSYANTISSTGSYALPDGTYITAYAPSSTGNNELKWETSEQTDLGFDVKFLRHRLSFTFDWFNKETKDLIVTGITPSTVVGNTASPVNAGNIYNRGIELELGWQDVIGQFSYSIRANASTLKNKVTYIHESLDAIDGTTFHTYGAITRFEVGMPAWYFYGYKYTGIDPETGDPTFEDLNGDGQIGDSDKTYIGDGIPDLTYGITISAAWKGLDFIIFGTGATGNQIYACLNRTDYTYNKLSYFVENRWTTTNTSGTQPRAGAADLDKYMVSSASVFDGSYFKIKQIQLGYTFPKKWMNAVKIDNLRVYGSLDDFITFTNYPGFDPEVVSTSGVDKGSYPTSKKVVFGVTVTF